MVVLYSFAALEGLNDLGALGAVTKPECVATPTAGLGKVLRLSNFTALCADTADDKLMIYVFLFFIIILFYSKSILNLFSGTEMSNDSKLIGSIKLT